MTSFVLFQIIIFLADLVVGSILFLKPAMAIEMQRKFYEKINWRIEPINMQQELLSTKIMGLLLIVAPTAIMIYSLYKTF